MAVGLLIPLATNTLVKPGGKVWAGAESCNKTKNKDAQKAGMAFLNVRTPDQ
ncbi:MAG TPA: hypothetical protein VM843_09595 [Flavisolibacter sp.]|nr:hypothetical protein [Flavisolibacter sp.]